MSFETCRVDDMELSKARMEAYIFGIILWKVQNHRLKLKQDKTEVVVFSSDHY